MFMKMKLTSWPILIAAFILVFSACGKEDDDAPTPKTKTQLLTQGPWIFLKATASGSDITGSVSNCLKDNVVTFLNDGNCTVSEGLDVCTPSYAGTRQWAFQSNETIIHLSSPLFPGGSNDFTLVSLTETSLVLSQQMTIPPYPTTTVEVTFKH